MLIKNIVLNLKILKKNKIVICGINYLIRVPLCYTLINRSQDFFIKNLNWQEKTLYLKIN